MTEIISNMSSSIISIEPNIRKSGKILGYSVWLEQGTINNPTEYVIDYSEIDEYIIALNNAKNEIQIKLKNGYNNKGKIS